MKKYLILMLLLLSQCSGYSPIFSKNKINFYFDNININSNEIYEGLLFTRKLMENKFFIPNNIKFPLSRKIFENKFLEIN